MKEAVIVTFIFGVITLLGFLSARYGIKQFMSDKCKQWSSTYQFFGFGGAMVMAYAGISFLAMFVTLIICIIYPPFYNTSMFG